MARSPDASYPVARFASGTRKCCRPAGRRQPAPPYGSAVTGDLTGKIGRVSDAVPAGGARRGEVMIDGQAYYALPADVDAPVPTGTRVVVVEYFPPRTVVVTPM